MRDDLLALPGISQVELFGDREYEVLVEISEGTLKKYGLTLSTVADLINRNFTGHAGGKSRYRCRGNPPENQRATLSGQVNLQTWSFSRSVKVRSFAWQTLQTLTDTFEDKDVHPRMDGKPAIVINVDKTSEEDALEIAQEVKDYVKERNRSLPPECAPEGLVG